MIQIYCGFIVGGPRETTETMERTLDFAKHLLLDVAPGSFECSASFLTPLPGTDIRARPDQYGVKLIDPDLVTSSNFNFCTAETEHLDREAINNFQRRFVEEIGNAISAGNLLAMRHVATKMSRVPARSQIVE